MIILSSPSIVIHYSVWFPVDIIRILGELTGGPRRTSQFHRDQNQDHHGKVSYKTTWTATGTTVERHDDENPLVGEDRITYRIDRNEMTGGMGMARANILSLFMEGGDEKRRRLVVDLEEPKFSSAWHDVMKVERPRTFKELQSLLDEESMNDSQKLALNRILDGTKYCYCAFV